MDKHPVILAQMIHKERPSWSPEQKHTNKRLLRNTAFFAAVSLCLGLYTFFSIAEPQKIKAVMSHISTGFEYNETLGRLHLVNNLLPASAMVFLNNDSLVQDFQSPVSQPATHDWTQQEPWFEYAGIGNVSACQTGEVVTIVKNNAGSHTLRILHSDGYESIYSGLHAVHIHEHDTVTKGQIIGTSIGNAAFELRRDGVSVLPVFSQI